MAKTAAEKLFSWLQGPVDFHQIFLWQTVSFIVVYHVKKGDFSILYFQFTMDRRVVACLYLRKLLSAKT